MKRNADGKIVGDKLTYPRAKVGQLARWFGDDFDGKLQDGNGLAVFEIGPGGLESLIEALQEAAKESQG